jgi:hypothetical protein
MLKEFMIYVFNEGDAKAKMSAEKHLEFVKKCEVYITKLKAGDNLIAAQPVHREGISLAKNGNNWYNIAIDVKCKVQVGYYHIRAADMNEALLIAKENPEFEYVPTASVEIRPLKMTEEKTGFVYPSK